MRYGILTVMSLGALALSIKASMLLLQARLGTLTNRYVQVRGLPMANRWSVPDHIGLWVGLFVPPKPSGLQVSGVERGAVWPESGGATRAGGIGEPGDFELRQ
jgi:hypothetical protein